MSKDVADPALRRPDRVQALLDATFGNELPFGQIHFEFLDKDINRAWPTGKSNYDPRANQADEAILNLLDEYTVRGKVNDGTTKHAVASVLGPTAKQKAADAVASKQASEREQEYKQRELNAQTERQAALTRAAAAAAQRAQELQSAKDARDTIASRLNAATAEFEAQQSDVSAMRGALSRADADLEQKKHRAQQLSDRHDSFSDRIEAARRALEEAPKKLRAEKQAVLDRLREERRGVESKLIEARAQRNDARTHVTSWNASAMLGTKRNVLRSDWSQTLSKRTNASSGYASLRERSTCQPVWDRQAASRVDRPHVGSVRGGARDAGVLPAYVKESLPDGLPGAGKGAARAPDHLHTFIHMR